MRRVTVAIAALQVGRARTAERWTRAAVVGRTPAIRRARVAAKRCAATYFITPA